MIKILKEGKDPIKEKEVECQCCHSILSYNPRKDLNYTTVYNMNTPKGFINLPHITCPYCKTKIFVGDEWVLDLIKKGVLK